MRCPLCLQRSFQTIHAVPFVMGSCKIKCKDDLAERIVMLNSKKSELAERWMLENDGKSKASAW